MAALIATGKATHSPLVVFRLLIFSSLGAVVLLFLVAVYLDVV